MWNDAFLSLRFPFESKDAKDQMKTSSIPFTPLLVKRRVSLHTTTEPTSPTSVLLREKVFEFPSLSIPYLRPALLRFLLIMSLSKPYTQNLYVRRVDEGDADAAYCPR